MPAQKPDPKPEPKAEPEPTAAADEDAGLVEKVRAIIADAFGKLLDDGAAVVDDAATAAKGAEPAEEHLTFRQVEERMEQMVAKAVADLKGMEPAKAAAAVEGATKAIAESPPGQSVRRVERWLWGEGKGN